MMIFNRRLSKARESINELAQLLLDPNLLKELLVNKEKGNSARELRT